MLFFYKIKLALHYNLLIHYAKGTLFFDVQHLKIFIFKLYFTPKRDLFKIFLYSTYTLSNKLFIFF